jgi:hypothetical protein
MDKIIIVSLHSVDRTALLKNITDIDDSLKIASSFTSDLSKQNLTKENNTLHEYYNDIESINLDYKNNSLLYISSTDELSYGVTLDEYYNSDIILADISDFNTISDKTFNSVNNIVVWIDTKYNSNIHNKRELKETKFLMERIAKHPYMYFMETEDMSEAARTILTYVTSSSEKMRKLILEEHA